MIIKNREQLKDICDSLYDQGFGYMGDTKLHEHKIDNIINNTNKLGVDEYNRKELLEKIDNNSDYDDIKIVIEEHFTKFSPDSKIMEYIRTFDVQSSDECRTPSKIRPGDSGIRKWEEFKDKYKLGRQITKGDKNAYVYNLDKNILKIKFSGTGYSDLKSFERLYKLVFNKDCPDLEETIKVKSGYSRAVKWGEYINLGEIEIKFYLKGSADIKGNLEKLKQYYFDFLNQKGYGIHVIIYKGKTNIVDFTSND